MSTNLNRILVPVDGSDDAVRAARFAAGLAADTEAEIILTHVYDATSAALLGLVALSKPDIDETMDQIAAAHLEKAKTAIEGNVRVRSVARIGHPAREIIDLAKSEKPDMIVIGCRGQGEFRRLLLGSVSEQVVHHAPCPVTVVR